MSKIVIKKRVSLDFLGEDYKDAYLDFQSIPLKDYEGVLKDIEKLESESDKSKSLSKVSEYISKYFLSGKFPVEGKLEDIGKEDLDGLDREAAMTCFQRVMGMSESPKLETQSSNTSSTEDQPPSSTPSTNTDESST